MVRAIRIGILILLLTASAAIGTLAYYGAHALASCTDAAHSFQATLEAVNRPCVAGRPCGTLADVNRTLASIRGTFGQVELAAKHENAQLTTLDGQERTLFSDLHGVLRDARETIRGAQGLTQVASGTLGATQDTLKSSQVALVSLRASLDASKGLIDALHRRADDQRIDDTLTHLDATSAHVDGATGDVQAVFDRVAHPPPCRGRWCWAIKTGEVLSAAHNVPEFGYWTDELIQSLRRH
jgi:hypothetical protein